MLDNQYAYLYGYVAGPDAQPTAGAYERFEDLNAQWAEISGRLEPILETDVAAFNRSLAELDVPSVIVPQSDGGM